MANPPNKKPPSEERILTNVFSPMRTQSLSGVIHHKPIPTPEEDTVYVVRDTDLKAIAAELRDKKVLCVAESDYPHDWVCGTVNKPALQYVLQEHERHNTLAGIDSPLLLTTNLQERNPYQAQSLADSFTTVYNEEIKNPKAYVNPVSLYAARAADIVQSDAHEVTHLMLEHKYNIPEQAIIQTYREGLVPVDHPWIREELATARNQEKAADLGAVCMQKSLGDYAEHLKKMRARHGEDGPAITHPPTSERIEFAENLDANPQLKWEVCNTLFAARPKKDNGRE